jgi:hypothetical protein
VECESRYSVSVKCESDTGIFFCVFLRSHTHAHTVLLVEVELYARVEAEATDVDIRAQVV